MKLLLTVCSMGSGSCCGNKNRVKKSYAMVEVKEDPEEHMLALVSITPFYSSIFQLAKKYGTWENGVKEMGLEDNWLFMEQIMPYIKARRRIC